MTPENLKILLEFANKIFNSGIGPALLISATFLVVLISPWGLAPKLDELVRNTAILSERIAQMTVLCGLRPTEKIQSQ